MPDLAPALADRARRLRAAGRRIKDVAAELGVSEYAVKRATVPGFAERQREHWRKTDAQRVGQRIGNAAWMAYQLGHYHATKGLTVDDARRLAEALKERRRQRGLDQLAAAREFGKTLQTYQRWEAGLCPRSDIRLVALAIRGFEAPRPSSQGACFDPRDDVAITGD